MRLGYSFWGFLGHGITDTPDGGRSHRRPFINGLRSRGHDIVFLQANRDSLEAATDFTDTYEWDRGLPDIDALFLEWRWPIAGRNTTSCGTPGHTCDLHRQQQLLDYYTYMRCLPTILWDKDRKLPPTDPLRHQDHVIVCEAALYPTDGATALLFPVSDNAIDTADPAALAAAPRPICLAYVGNQYDRDHAFDRYFASPAVLHRNHLVAGKWTAHERWQHVNFVGRVPFAEVGRIYIEALATVLLLPDRYATAGQMTQRLPEALLAGCLPITPADYRGAQQLTPAKLHVRDGRDVAATLDWLNRIARTDTHAELIEASIGMLDVFRLSRQLDIVDDVLDRCVRVG
jgi:hypothetical protein